MVTITYEALNDLVHSVAGEIEKTTGLNKDTMLDLFALNDALTEYLARYGVQFDEELRDVNLIEYHGVGFRARQPGPVFLDGVPLDPAHSQRVWNHSPDGFAWGYGGSGPAQLALAILLAAGIDKDMAVRLHQDFKREWIEPLPQEGPWSIEVDIPVWVGVRAAEKGTEVEL